MTSLNENWCEGCNPDNCVGCSNTKEGRLDKEKPNTAEAMRRRKEEFPAYKEDCEAESPKSRIRKKSQEHFERG